MMNDLLDRQLGQDASEDEHGTQEDPLDALFDFSPQQTSSPLHPMMGSCQLRTGYIFIFSLLFHVADDNINKQIAEV